MRNEIYLSYKLSCFDFYRCFMKSRTYNIDDVMMFG